MGGDRRSQHLSVPFAGDTFSWDHVQSPVCRAWCEHIASVRSCTLSWFCSEVVCPPLGERECGFNISSRLFQPKTPNSIPDGLTPKPHVWPLAGALISIPTSLQPKEQRLDKHTASPLVASVGSELPQALESPPLSPLDSSPPHSFSSPTPRTPTPSSTKGRLQVLALKVPLLTRSFCSPKEWDSSSV